MSDEPKIVPAAISIPFATMPDSNVVRGDRYRLGFYAYEKCGPDGTEEEQMQKLREKCQGTDLVDHFRGQTSRQDRTKTNEILHKLPAGYTTIDVLPELIGLPVSNLVLAYLAALRPSAIRITGGEVHCDAMTWRVTVTVDKDDKITDISQEVSVGFGTGADMNGLLREFKGGPKAPVYTGSIGHTAALAKVDFS